MAIAGNDKGRFGKVLRRTNKRVVVQGLNVRKKHCKPTQEGQQGQILDREMPMNISNVQLCTEEGQRVKVRVRSNAEEQKELFYNNGEQDILYRSVMNEEG
jgi:large subunit ribosomal protein L24